MKTAGDVLSALFDRQFVEKAQSYSKLFDSWEDITSKNGIAAAAAHSRIKELDRGILLVEMDHPGWKQIIQTKQTKLLNDFRLRFPDMDISGISLMLSRSESQAEQETHTPSPVEEPDVYNEPTAQLEPATKSIEDIKDESFKKMLKNLGQNIADRNTSNQTL
jgi:hypothetical protein